MIEELRSLLGDPAHWAFEGITDATWTAVLFLVGRFPFRRWVDRHDREKHPS